MNPVDHPHGGGEGRTSGGRHPVTPWGVSTKGKKTRRNKKTNVHLQKAKDIGGTNSTPPLATIKLDAMNIG